jgi:hypothetical protein
MTNLQPPFPTFPTQFIQGAIPSAPEMSLEEQEEFNNTRNPAYAYDYNVFLQNMEYEINQLNSAIVAHQLNTVSKEFALVETETNNLFDKQCQKLNNLIEPNTLDEFLQNMNIFD